MVKIVVGQAKFEDVFAIEECLEIGRGEAESPLPPPDQPFAYQALMDIIKFGFAWVAKAEGRIIGVMLAEPHRLWYRKEVHYIQSVEFYVVPEFRRGGTASKLIEKAKATAERAGAPLIVSVTYGYRAEIKDRFVERQGLTYLGGNLLFTPNKEALPEEEKAV